MKEVTSPARPKWSFPIPVDVHCQRSDEQKDENDERPATLQSTKLWPRLPAHKSYCGAIEVARPRKMYFWIFPVVVLGSSLRKVTLCGAMKWAMFARANSRSSLSSVLAPGSDHFRFVKERCCQLAGCACPTRAGLSIIVR